MLKDTLTTCAATVIISVSLTGCSSTPTRSGSGLTDEINPAHAHTQRQRQEALEHYSTASDLHIAGDTDEALAEYRRALELNEKLYAAWNNMGQLLLMQGNYSDAVAAYQIASGLEPTDPRPEYNIGLAYQKVGWAQDSYTHFENALDRDPNFIPALHGIIRSAEMLGMGDPKIMGYIKNAQLQETSDQWREYLSTQYFRVQAAIDNAS